MTGTQALLTLETFGYSFSLQPDGKIRAVKPVNPPAEAQQLMGALKADKPSAVNILQQRAGGATIEDQITRSAHYANVKALKLAQDAGEIEVLRVKYHQITGLIEAFWRPVTPLPFLDIGKYKEAVQSRMEALLGLEPTPEVVAEYNLLAL